MVKIRLTRVGRKNDISFRIVVQDVRVARDGKVIEIIGTYSPRLKQKTINKDRALYWLGVGAKPSGTVHNFFLDEGIVKAEKHNVFHRVGVAEAAVAAKKEAKATETKAA